MRIDIRECDDWVALYKDGKKVEEGHSVPLKHALEALGIEFNAVWLEVDEISITTPDGKDAFPEELEVANS